MQDRQGLHLVCLMVKIRAKKEGKADRSLSGDKAAGVQGRSDQARVYFL